MRKTFSVAAANRTLPLVSQIAQDIVAVRARWEERVHAYEQRVADGTLVPGNPEARLLQDEIETAEREIEQFERELAGLGVEIKDQRHGLIDFPSVRDGKRIYLCWRLGEPEVRHWHEMDTGFLGRQPVDEHCALE